MNFYIAGFGFTILLFFQVLTPYGHLPHLVRDKHFIFSISAMK